MNGNYDINELLKASKSGNASDILNKLSSEDAARIKNLLSNRELTEKLLKSEQAQKIINSFMKDGR